MQRCKVPKKYEKIRRNLTTWEQKKGLDGKTKTVNTAKYTMKADLDGELLGVMLAIASERDDDNTKEEYELRDIRHSHLELQEENTSNVDDIFFLKAPNEKSARNFDKVFKTSSNEKYEKQPK